jgi:6-phosphogluconolactonase (cycloisomerase 2 family)
MLKKAAALFLVCGSIATWVGCGTTSSRFLYAAIPASSEIVAYREDPNSGVLTPLAVSPILAGQGVQSLAMHPSKKFLYAANSGATPQGNISLYTISSTGTLTEVTPRTSAGSVPTILVMDSTGSYLYVGNLGSEDIYVFSIDASTGALTQVGTNYPIGMVPMNMQLSPSGNFLYVTGEGATGFIEAFPVSQGKIGPLPVQGSPFQTGNNPIGLAINSAGTFLYTANKTDNSISEFTVNTDGSLTPLPNSPVGQSYLAPDALLIDKTGKYLYIANQGSTNLSAYTIASDGGLTLLSSSPFGTGSEPSYIATDSSGKFLFVGNQASSASVQSFALNPNTGTLTSVQTYTVPGTATSIAITP